jgi:hypothetical protein
MAPTGNLRPDTGPFLTLYAALAMSKEETVEKREIVVEQDDGVAAIDDLTWKC